VTRKYKYTLLGYAKYPEAADMDELEKEFKDGNGVALPLAILACGKRGDSLPAWVANAWQEACYKVDQLDSDWNDVLGGKTEGQRNRERALAQKRFLIVYHIQRGDYKGIPIKRDPDGSDLFSRIAADLTDAGERAGAWGTVTPREAKEIYYSIEGKRPPDPRLKFPEI
jgi:hypothetical protein